MIKAHIIKLYPTKSQDTFFKKSSGVARFAYNWALNKWQNDYKEGVKQSAYSLIKLLNSIKKVEFPWMQETGKCAPQYAIHNLESAYIKMWKEKCGYPKFKKKGEKDVFVAVENKEQFKQKDYKIWIPRLGWVKCAENLRFEGKVNNVVIKRTADIWFACINIEVQESIPILKPINRGENQAIVGIDFGISKMMVCSDGTVYENPCALKSNLKSLKRLQKGLSRKVNGSGNRRRAKNRLAKKHYRISCIRNTAIHQATTAVIKKYNKIIIESLRPKKMVENHNLAQALSDAAFGEITRQLAYKCLWYNKVLERVDQWYPSSKICSGCGKKKDKLSLSERTYKCEGCGLEIDRDLNAAINLASYGSTSKFEGSKACGEGSSVPEMEYSPSVKHELNFLTGLCRNVRSTKILNT